jgi:hypothetical protein
MMKKLMKKTSRPEKAAEDLLRVGLSEIEEIAEGLFRKIDERIRELKAVEERIDGKILDLERLLKHSEGLRNADEQGADRRSREILALSGRGLKVDEIAGIVDMPKGEVELILGLGR